MLVNKEKELEGLAKKAKQMEPQSIQTLIFTADVLLARDRMERDRDEKKSVESR